MPVDRGAFPRFLSTWRIVIYRFGEFTLNGETRQLLVRQQEIHVSPKAFELLTLLLANRSRALSKVEIQEHLWPSTFVEETNVAGLVNEIRRALRDHATTPRFIRTIYRFGYRFVGAATEDGSRAGQVTATKRYLEDGQRQLMLMEGANVVGRAPDATISIDSPGISRYHARFTLTNTAATVEDLGSKNGTHVNGTRISGPVALADGDEVRLGAMVLTFRTDSSLGATETLPTAGS
jgi:DNA-binding winged helix-turn-helix (wHTH) protein